MYLAKRFGDDQIRLIWETLATVDYPGITSFDAVIPTGLESALNEFGVWNYFTKDRANTEYFYSDGNLFSYTIGIDRLENFYPVTDSLSTPALTSSYVEFPFVGGWDENEALAFGYSQSSGRIHKSSIMFYNSPDDFLIQPIVSKEMNIALGKTWNRAVLITSCVNTASAPGVFSYTADLGIKPNVKSEFPAELVFTGVNPNPFNASVAIRFIMPRNGRATVRAYDILGRKAADLYDGDLSAGEKSLIWKPENLSGGVYLVRIVSPYGAHTAKVLLLK